jgi:uncharacterized RDD family membrane protein YckC
VICKKCNFENDSVARFCENCGASLPEETNFPQQAHYPKASLGKRFLARVIDSLVMIPVYLYFVIQYAQNMSHTKIMPAYNEPVSSGGIGMGLLLLCIPAIVYFFIKDGMGKGQSWGKKAMGLMVVYLPDNAPCTKGQSSVRFLVEVFLCVTLIGWFIEPIMAFVDNNGRRLADLAAKTQVVEVNMFNR